MIQSYLKAENLKFKHSLFRKLIILIPAALILISVVLVYLGMGLGGFGSVIVCNWCMPIASLSVVILCHFVNQKDQKQRYRAIYSLPIDLKKVFISKITLTALQLLGISFVIVIFTFVSEAVSSGISYAAGHAGYYMLGYCFLWLSLLWQIPFCLFLDQKAGFVCSVCLNLFASALGGIFLFLAPFFWFVPYSWPARLMVTLFGVMPSGLTVESDSRLILSLGESMLLVLASFLALFFLSVLCSCWYERQVYRG